MVGAGVTFAYFNGRGNTNNTSEPDDYLDDVMPEDNNVVSQRKILQLSETVEFIDTSIDDTISVSYYPEKMSYSFTTVKGKLYLTMNDHEVRVTDIDENVVVIKDAKNNCDLENEDILILTNDGNLYVSVGGTGYEGRRFEEQIYKNFENLTEVTLNLKKINNVPILAFTTVSSDSRNSTCGLGKKVVYGSDGNYYYYKTTDSETGEVKYELEKVDKIIKEQVELAKCMTLDLASCGLLIYTDNTVSVDGINLIKNKDGNDLVLEKYSIDENDNIHITDKDKYTSVITFDKEVKVEYGGVDDSSGNSITLQ